MANYEPCSICEEYIEGVKCDKDQCPVAKMKAEIERLNKELEKIKSDLKWWLNTNEEKGVIYIPEHIVRKMTERCENG